MRAPSIVLIDDDPDKRFLLTRYLAKSFPQHEVFALASCAAAKPIIYSSFSKIVITNGHIAEEDGISFAAQISRQTGTPVIIISLHSELEKKAIAAGVTAFVETGDNEAIHAAVTEALSLAETHSGLN
jgi:DNA-binding NtrC family response regulator